MDESEMTTEQAQELLENAGCRYVSVIQRGNSLISANVPPGIFISVSRRTVEEAYDVLGVMLNALRNDPRLVAG